MSLGGVLKSRIAASAIILSFFMPFFFISVISGCVEKNEAEVDSPVQVVRVKIKDVRDAAKEDVKPADEKTKQVDAIGPDVAVDDKRENLLVVIEQIYKTNQDGPKGLQQNLLWGHSHILIRSGILLFLDCLNHYGGNTPSIDLARHHKLNEGLLGFLPPLLGSQYLYGG